jgi:hypothetical protein
VEGATGPLARGILNNGVGKRIRSYKEYFRFIQIF